MRKVCFENTQSISELEASVAMAKAAAENCINLFNGLPLEKISKYEHLEKLLTGNIQQLIAELLPGTTPATFMGIPVKREKFIEMMDLDLQPILEALETLPPMNEFLSVCKVSGGKLIVDSAMMEASKDRFRVYATNNKEQEIFDKYKQLEETTNEFIKLIGGRYQPGNFFKYNELHNVVTMKPRFFQDLVSK